MERQHPRALQNPRQTTSLAALRRSKDLRAWHSENDHAAKPDENAGKHPYSCFELNLLLIRSRASSESFCGTASTISSGCWCPVSRRNCICRPYRRHHLHRKRWIRRPSRWRQVSFVSGAIDCSRAASRQPGESSHTQRPSFSVSFFTQIISPVDSRFVAGRGETLRLLFANPRSNSRLVGLLRLHSACQTDWFPGNAAKRCAPGAASPGGPSVHKNTCAEIGFH